MSLDDATALDRIAHAMGAEWNGDTADLVALLVRATGREIADSDEFEDDDEAGAEEDRISRDIAEREARGEAPYGREPL